MALDTRQLDRRSALELRHIDRKVIRLESTAAWRRVHRLGQITHFAGTYDRPDWAEQAGAELVDLASRQLRMLDDGGNDAA